MAAIVYVVLLAMSGVASQAIWALMLPRSEPLSLAGSIVVGACVLILADVFEPREGSLLRYFVVNASGLIVAPLMVWAVTNYMGV